MPDLLLILIGTVLVNHFLLVRRNRPPIPRSTTIGFEKAVAVAAPSCIGVVMTAAVMLPLNRLVLVPFNADYLFLLALAGTSVATTQCLALLRLCAVEGMPANEDHFLVVTNSIVLVVGLRQATSNLGSSASLALTVGVAAAFGLLLLAATDLFERIDQESVPQPFRGGPIVLIAASLAALALLGLTGVLPD